MSLRMAHISDVLFYSIYIGRWFPLKKKKKMKTAEILIMWEFFFLAVHAVF